MIQDLGQPGRAEPVCCIYILIPPPKTIPLHNSSTCVVRILGAKQKGGWGVVGGERERERRDVRHLIYLPYVLSYITSGGL